MKLAILSIPNPEFVQSAIRKIGYKFEDPRKSSTDLLLDRFSGLKELNRYENITGKESFING